MTEDRAIVERAHQLWAAGDFEAFLACLTEDVVHVVNVGDDELPYGGDTVGRAMARERLQLVRDTFDIQAFVIEKIAHEAAFTRTHVLAYYKHKRTGERLDMKIRLLMFLRDGRICRIQEYHDAAYLEAFHRFVSHIEETLAAAAPAAAERISSDASP